MAAAAVCCCARAVSLDGSVSVFVNHSLGYMAAWAAYPAVDLLTMYYNCGVLTVVVSLLCGRSLRFARERARAAASPRSSPETSAGAPFAQTAALRRRWLAACGAAHPLCQEKETLKMQLSFGLQGVVVVVSAARRTLRRRASRASNPRCARRPQRRRRAAAAESRRQCAQRRERKGNKKVVSVGGCFVCGEGGRRNSSVGRPSISPPPR